MGLTNFYQSWYIFKDLSLMYKNSTDLTRNKRTSHKIIELKVLISLNYGKMGFILAQKSILRNKIKIIILLLKSRKLNGHYK